jgi:hypothetical protein
MGVLYNCKVYGWRKPTLTVQAVAGGSLLADTTYYVMGLMSKTLVTYVGYGGPCSDVYSVNTTQTNRSIQITENTYRDIVAFSDFGSGQTQIESTRHCLDSQDQIIIDSGTYAGTWDVNNWIDYNNFTILTPYVDNTPVQFRTEGPYNLARGMVYYVNPTYPWYGDDLDIVIQNNYWTRRPWETDNLENPLTITAQPTDYFARECCHPELAGLNRGYYKSLVDYGTIGVVVTGSLSLDGLRLEVKEAGFEYNCTYGLAGYANNYHFGLAGYIYSNTDMHNMITVNAVSASIWGEIYHYYHSDGFVFNNCCLMTPCNHFSAAMQYTANDSVIYDASTSNTYLYWISGENLTLYAIPRGSSLFGDEVGLTYYDYERDDDVPYSKVIGKTFKTLGVNQLYQISYNGNKLENCGIEMPIYFVMRYGNNPEIYMGENVYLAEAGSYDIHFRIYDYDADQPNYIRWLNVNTDHASNIKKCTGVVNQDTTFDFFRRVEVYVQEDGVAITGATVRITDSAENEYTETTDSNGYAFIDVLEQRFQKTLSDPGDYDWTGEFDTHYTDFVITVTKNGYYPAMFEYATLYDNALINTTLESGNVEYLEQIIQADLEEDQIYAKV